MFLTLEVQSLKTVNIIDTSVTKSISKSLKRGSRSRLGCLCCRKRKYVFGS